MGLFILSFIAGVLTIAAPCILPLLPVVVGGSVVNSLGKPASKQWYRPIIIAISLAASVVSFTLLLKSTTALLGVPQAVWNIVAGGIILLFGASLLWPAGWERLMVASRLHTRSNQLLKASYAKQGLKRDVLVGAALGPVFASCSPTYAFIVAVVLPETFTKGVIYLMSYAAGLAATLLIVSIIGQSAARKLGWLSNPNGWIRRIVGLMFLAVGITVLFGWDRSLQSYILDQGWYDPIADLEHRLRD